ncbi:MAG: cupin domain-containing protein [Gammaproteobacteria bacterium]
MAFKHRRVVTGLDEHGKSCVISDATLDQLPTYDGPPVVIWRTDTYPVDNRGNADGAARFGIETFDSSSFFVLFTAEPGKPSAWHATNSIDYVVVLSGRVMLELETGGVELGAGDLIVDRGVTHSWRAIGDETATLLGAVIRAQPLGAGSHFDAGFDQYLKD